VVSYLHLQLAHDERHPETGNHVAKVIHSFGPAERVDRAALARLVSSLSRFLTPEEAVAAATGMTWRWSTPAAWAGRGRWTRFGNGSGSARRSAIALPPGCDSGRLQEGGLR
jgi:hypothetical protein